MYIELNTNYSLLYEKFCLNKNLPFKRQLHRMVKDTKTIRR